MYHLCEEAVGVSPEFEYLGLAFSSPQNENRLASRKGESNNLFIIKGLIFKIIYIQIFSGNLFIESRSKIRGN